MKIENFKSRSCSSNEPEIIAEKQREKDIFGQFENKKVRIKYGATNDWSKISNKEMEGRIIQKRDNNGPTGQFMILPKRARNKGYYLTLGLYDGWSATITINEINEL